MTIDIKKLEQIALEAGFASWTNGGYTPPTDEEENEICYVGEYPCGDKVKKFAELLLKQKENFVEWKGAGDTPENGKWYWVSDGSNVWPACSDSNAAGRWSNLDTWEDFEGSVKYFQEICMPPAPKEKDANDKDG